MIYVGIAIIAVTGYAVVKGYEVRMVLFLSGLLMGIIALKPLEPFIGFYKMTITDPLTPTIVCAIAFAEVLKFTRCDQHIIRFLTLSLGKKKWILIPGTTLATLFINIAIISPAGCSAAVGAIAIPVLMAAGIHPAAAAAAVFAGTFGSALSPANTHNLIVGDMARISPVQVVLIHAPTTVTLGLLAAFGTYLVIHLRKEDSGYVPESTEVVDELKINPLKVLVPLLPIVLLFLSSPPLNVINFPKQYSGLSVVVYMIVGTLACGLLAWTNPGDVSRAFFRGVGWGYGEIMGIVMAAAAFTSGMAALGLISTLIEIMKNSQAAVKLASVYGPFLIAVLGGSGDAATIAFNQAVTPHADAFHMTIARLGSVAHVAGVVGRTMSPVAGACFAAALIAKANPFEVAKRTAPSMILGTGVILLMLF